ncbi:MAG: family 78 glycoside hydrolase catalytic domain, partial [Oscillospiraceae bacterium]|nr:family 78 glycoside hydrolase catalytic domain [Oscillospiraceae bacterium]
MDQSLNIIRFTVNGAGDTAWTDSGELKLALFAQGGAQTMRLRIFRREALCWDSGERPWEPYCRMECPALQPCSCYRVVASVNGTASRELKLLTGLMGRDWQGKWIEPEQECAVKERPIQFFEQFVPMPDHLGGHDRLKSVRELRRVFTLERLPEQAVFCASAQGIYALWLNGVRVDERRLAPETTPYETMLYYQAYDVTGLLRTGENTLRVLLGDGWWIGRIGITGDSCQYGDRLAFLGQLTLDFGGERQVLPTDERFESRASRIRYADLFMGEKWDCSAPEEDWMPCHGGTAPSGRLELQTTAPVSVWTELAPKEILTTPRGELVVDFGQCLAGVVELELSCPKGCEVILEHSETLDAQGNFFRNILGRNKDQQDRVICGEGVTRFCPEFTYHGFRYVKLEGAAASDIRSIRALAVGTALEEAGSFSCSHSALTQLQHNIRWATRSNMVSVPTDCPQREKAGWTGDIQVFAPTGCFNYDLHGFLSAWLGQMRLSQAEDGAVPIVIPSYPAQTAIQTETFGGNVSAAWSDACVLVPLALYRQSGDKGVLRDNLAMMEKWLGYVERAAAVPPGNYESLDAEAKQRSKYLWTEGFHFGDWLIPSYQDDVMAGAAITAKIVASCQYAVTVAGYLEVLEALDEPEEKIERYRTLLGNIRRAVREEYVRSDGTVEGDLQGLYVMVLYAGAVEGELAQKVADRLARLIEENGGGLDTGFVSVPHLLDMLAQNGHEDLAWKLLFRTEAPGWLYQVEHGATSMWENWNAVRPDGTVEGDLQGLYVMVLYAGAVEGELAQK